MFNSSTDLTAGIMPGLYIPKHPGYQGISPRFRCSERFLGGRALCARPPKKQLDHSFLAGVLHGL